MSLVWYWAYTNKHDAVWSLQVWQYSTQCATLDQMSARAASVWLRPWAHSSSRQAHW